jgi:hypothetical protein
MYPMYSNAPYFQVQQFAPIRAMIGWIWLLIPFFILELILKGYALWRAGRNNQPVWFVFLLILNTVGILPLIYLLFFQRRAVVHQEVAPASKQQTSSRAPRSRANRH